MVHLSNVQTPEKVKKFNIHMSEHDVERITLCGL